MTSVLEVLENTLATMAPETYEFASWDACTCGQIYLNAEGESGDRLGSGVALRETFQEESLYAATLRTIVEANDLAGTGEYDLGMFHELAATVSHWTEQRAGEIAREEDEEFHSDNPEGDEFAWAAAVEMVRVAIAYEERRLEEARLNVLAQAEAVVDAAAVVEEPVPA